MPERSPLTSVLYSLQVNGALPREVVATHGLARPGGLAAAFAAEQDARVLIHVLAAAADPTTRSTRPSAAFRAAVACVDAAAALLPARAPLVLQALAWLRACAKRDADEVDVPGLSFDALLAEVGRLPDRKRTDEASLAAAVAVQRLVQSTREEELRARADHVQSAVAFAARALAFARSKKRADYPAAFDAALAELATVVRAHAPAPELGALEVAHWMKVPGLAESLAPPS